MTTIVLLSIVCALQVSARFTSGSKGTYNGSHGESDESNQTNELNVNCIRNLY